MTKYDIHVSITRIGEDGETERLDEFFDDPKDLADLIEVL